ncbi:S8 family serine peptidase [Clavibacter phaseoli]|uniref:S8 family serine peptidase n=1 Tax=Clavibacter phaseoli TaxID=1734031 RepID=UPI000E66F353|nr:serine protease [Clavibacter phaseoli]UKF29761.1 serine protease [Clavibacter phaseoli]UKF35679.1 serine protease [Clavibacter phaseoli]
MFVIPRSIRLRSESDRASSLRRATASVAVTALVAAGLVTFGAGGAFAAPAPTVAKQASDLKDGRYIVTLADEAAATYQGGVSGLAATEARSGTQLDAGSAPVTAYTDYLEGQQEDVAASVGADIDYSYSLTVNGFSADLTAEQAAKLSSDRKVLSVEPDRIYHPTSTPAADFLGLTGPDGVWAKTGGQENAGEGAVIGVIDTGIAPENPSFAGEPLGTAAGDAPYRDGSTIRFDKGDGTQFAGVCQTGEQFTAADCSTKIVGARYFVDGFGKANIGNASTGEYVSPRDGDGHGSHTASTAAGDAGVEATIDGNPLGEISGVAPASKIAAYKVCWSGPDNSTQDDDGCAGADLVAAIEQATEDGVDVINYSIGGGSAQTTFSATDQAFLGAASAGIFVSASAGNSGPGASTLDNASPWITTVAASTVAGNFEATAKLGDGQQFAGSSITVTEPVTGDFVTAASVAAAGATTPNLCGPGSLDPAKTAGKIVLCERGTFDRVAKSAEVERAGGIGMVLVNPTPNSIDADTHSVPTVHLDADVYAAVSAYAATPGATVTLVPGNTTGVSAPTPQVAGFSSRGPVLADGSDILKPDVTAPGVSIIAATNNAEGGEPTFALLSGTSMAAPHVAGLALLYLGERPNASVSEIKSALMTTAYDTKDADGGTVTDPFTQGAGHVDPTRYLDAGLLYLNDRSDWVAYLAALGYATGIDPVDPSELNLASIAIGTLTGSETVTREVTSTGPGTYTASVQGLAGVQADVTPSTLEFTEAGQTKSFEVAFTRTTATVDEYATGSLTWTSADHVVRSPVAVNPVSIAAPAEVDGTGIDGSVDVTVTPGATGSIALTAEGLARGVVIPDPEDASSPFTGSGKAKDVFDYPITVPEGQLATRIDLDADDDASDLDLQVFRLEDGTPVEAFQSATSSADESVTIDTPTPGDYVVEVVVFSVPAGQSTEEFTVTQFDLSTTTDEGAFTVSPNPIDAVQSRPATYTASWSDLAPETAYLGRVAYSGSGFTTYVRVESGPIPAPVATAPPVITGTPVAGQTLTASPGTWDQEGLKFSYQWFADGKALPGQTRATYKVSPSVSGKSITVVVTAKPAEGPTGTATSEPVVVKLASTVTVSVKPPVLTSAQKAVVTVKVDSAAKAAPTGTVTVKVGADSFEVTLDAAGTGRVELPAYAKGRYAVTATYAGDTANAAKTSAPKYLYVSR